MGKKGCTHSQSVRVQGGLQASCTRDLATILQHSIRTRLVGARERRGGGSGVLSHHTTGEFGDLKTKKGERKGCNPITHTNCSIGVVPRRKGGGRV